MLVRCRKQQAFNQNQKGDKNRARKAHKLREPLMEFSINKTAALNRWHTVTTQKIESREMQEVKKIQTRPEYHRQNQQKHAKMVNL